MKYFPLHRNNYLLKVKRKTNLSILNLKKKRKLLISISIKYELSESLLQDCSNGWNYSLQSVRQKRNNILWHLHFRPVDILQRKVSASEKMLIALRLIFLSIVVQTKLHTFIAYKRSAFSLPTPPPPPPGIILHNLLIENWPKPNMGLIYISLLSLLPNCRM